MTDARRITVWVCDECSYWRAEQATGVHQTSDPADLRGRMVRHKLREVEFVDAARVAALEAENQELRRLLDDTAMDRAGIAGKLSAAEKLLSVAAASPEGQR